MSSRPVSYSPMDGNHVVEIEPIRGDVLLDRIFGWLSFVCAIPVLGLSIAKATGNVQPLYQDPAWLEPVRLTLIILAMMAFVMITLSRRVLFKAVAVIFVIRMVGLLATWKWSGGPRFTGTEFLFDAAALYYCWLRLKSPLD